MNTCIHCGACLRVCLGGVIRVDEDGPKVDASRCNGCGQCQAVCPTGAAAHEKAPLAPVLDPVLSYEDAARFLRTARSVRLYKPEPIPRDKVTRLLDVARFAQSGGNSQGVSYLVVNGREKVQRVLELFLSEVNRQGAEANRLAFAGLRACQDGRDGVFRGCPALLIALHDKKQDNGEQNCQFCMTFAALAAPSLGLGTCWAGYFEGLVKGAACPASIREYLGLRDNEQIGAVLMAGVPDVKYLRLVERHPLTMRFLGD